MPVGIINTLNRILPDMCKAAGVKRITSHSLSVSCASNLFNAGVDSKLIRDRTGHKSDALFKYEKPNEESVSNVSTILGPKCTVSVECKAKEEIGTNEKGVRLKESPFYFGNLNNCTVTFNVTNN